MRASCRHTRGWLSWRPLSTGRWCRVITATLGSSLDLHKLLIYPDTASEAVRNRSSAADHERRRSVARDRRWCGRAAVQPRAGFDGAEGAGGVAAVCGVQSPAGGGGEKSAGAAARAAEGAGGALTVGMLLVWVVPRLAMSTHYSPAWLGGGALVLRAAIWPWGAVETLMLSAAGPAALAVVTLLAWVFAAAWFGFTQFERGLRFDADAAEAGPLARGARTAGIVERFYSLPRFLFRDPHGRDGGERTALACPLAALPHHLHDGASPSASRCGCRWRWGGPTGPAWTPTS